MAEVFKVESNAAFKTRDYSEWEADYIAAKADGKKLWDQLGLPSDIRAGWQKAAKENKLYAFGPYSVPLDVVEAIEDDTRHMLRCAGITKKREDDGRPSATYVQILKEKVKHLEDDIKAKQKQIDTLLSLVGELRSAPGEEVEIEEDQCRLAGVDDEPGPYDVF